MLFLLRIEVSLPPDLPQSERDALRERETERALELIAAGTLLRIWRIVGRVANFSLWRTDSLEALHGAVGSLPMFPYMQVDVTPLIDHPVTAAADARNGRAP